MFDWLERTSYDAAPIEVQVEMRKKALMPTNMKATMPEAYRLWQTCELHNKLFWDGGIADQPHILMLEFAACERGRDNFNKHLARIRAKIGQHD